MPPPLNLHPSSPPLPNPAAVSPIGPADGVRLPGTLGSMGGPKTPTPAPLPPARAPWSVPGPLTPGPNPSMPIPGGLPPARAKMSNQTNWNKTMTPEQILIEKAAVPEFFAKVAAVTGVSPNNAQDAYDLRVLGDRVVAGVEHYVAKAAAYREAQASSLIKAAASAADEAAGIFPAPPAPTPTDPTKVAADLEAYEAALSIVKAAAEVMSPEVVGKKTPEEEEEEAKLKLNPAVAAA